MLEIRPICENCGKSLPNDSNDAMICTFECTFCSECVNTVLYNVCPNCGGGFEKRPIRPKEKLINNPAKADAHFKPINPVKFEALLKKNKNLSPSER